MDPSVDIGTAPPEAASFDASQVQAEFNQGATQGPEQKQAEIEEARIKLFNLSPLEEAATDEEKAARESEINELTQKAGILGDCVWKKEDGAEAPVKIAKYLGKRDDGKVYVQTDNPDLVEEIPFDELTYPENSDVSQAQEEQVPEDMDALRDSVGRERTRAKMLLENNLNNEEIFNTPELKIAAKKVLSTDTADLKSTLLVLKRLKECVGEDAEKLAQIGEVYDAIYASAQIVDSEGKIHLLSDLDKEFESVDNARKSEIKGLKDTGKYKYKFDAQAFSEPKKYEGKTDSEIVDIELSAHLKMLEAKLVELEKAGKKDEAAEVQALIAQHRFADQSKGKLGGLNKASFLIGIDRHLKNMEEEGLSDEVGESVLRLFENNFKQVAERWRTHRGLNEIQINSIKEFMLNGQIDEVLKIQGVADSWLAENMFGRKFKTNDELNEFMTALMNDKLREMMLKKYGTNLGLMAILMLMAAGGLKNMFSQAAFENGGRR